MSLGGLAIAIGELVDDAIIDVENVVRRLRRERATARRRACLGAGGRLSRQHRDPHLRRVRDRHRRARVPAAVRRWAASKGGCCARSGFAYVVALTASLLVALTVTPVLCSWLLPTSKLIRSGHGARVGARLKARVRTGWLLRARHYWRTVVASAAVLLVAAVVGILRRWDAHSCRSSTRGP